MNVYEKYWFRLFSAACAGVVLLALAACHTVRKSTVENTSDSVRSEFAEVKAETTESTSGSDTSVSDTATVVAHEAATVDVERDSVGRIVAVRWLRYLYGQSLQTRKEEGERWFYGLNATQHSEVRDSTQNHSEAREETKNEVSCGSRLLSITGLSLVACIILIYLFDWLYRIWKRRMGK